MQEKRIAVYGKDAEGKRKRAFDMVRIQGTQFLETKDRHGHKIITPVGDAMNALNQLNQQTD